MRVSILVKLLVAFLLVIAVGALPTVIYLQRGFRQQVLHEAQESLALRIRRIRPQLTPLSVPQRLQELQHLSAVMPERITYIDSAGNVLFDSHVAGVAKLENHLSRPEVQQVLSTRIADGVDSDAIGADTRLSTSTTTSTLYVACSAPHAAGGPPDILRLAMPVHAIDQQTGELMGVLRTSYAVSISAALLLSLLALFVVVRPLRKLAEAARRMAGGDYTAVRLGLPQDEIGDLGRTLNQLALEVRRSLDSVRGGEGLLVQLVEDLPWPVIIVDERLAPVAVNALGWEAAGTMRDRHVEVLRKFFQAPALSAALAAARESGDCQPVVSQQVRGVVSVLERSDDAPLHCFIGEGGRLPTEDEPDEAVSGGEFSALHHEPSRAPRMTD